MSIEARSAEPSSDEDLRDLVVRDPSKGWDLLWDLYGPMIRARAYSFRNLREHYADMLQEICLKILKDDCAILQKWKPSKGTLAAYLSCVARSVCLDYLKSSSYQYWKNKQTSPATDEDEHDLFDVLPSKDASPSVGLSNKELSILFFEAVHDLAERNRLKPEDVSMIFLRAKGEDYDQVAKITGKSKESLMMRFSRIRGILQTKLESLGITVEALIE